jgi:hypothetical protein
MLAVEITTVAELGTALGTLVLAFATFASVRSANRTAEIAERSLRIGLRPVLAQSRPEDPGEPVFFPEGVTLNPGHSLADIKMEEEKIFMAVPLRNVGSGMAVLHGWYLNYGWRRGALEGHPDPDTFRPQLRDLYIPPSDTGFWQGGLRDPEDDFYKAVKAALEGEGDDEGIALFLMYGDHEGGQRTISRFGLRPQEDGWYTSVTRHWNLDGAAPREAPPLSEFTGRVPGTVLPTESETEG